MSVALARARELGFTTVACASTGNLANAVAAHAAAAGLESYVFIPSDLEEQKILATGVYGTNLVAVQRQLRRRQPAVHRDLRRARLGVREHQHAPVLRRGLQDARLRDRRAARLAAPRPRRRADRLRLAVHQDRPRVRASGSSSGLVEGELPVFHGAQADGCSPVATRLPRRTGLLPAGEAGHDRQVAGDRQSRPTARTRSISPAGPSGDVDSVSDDEIREGIKLLARTTGIFTETAGGVTTAVLAKLARRGAIDPDERVVAYITGEGLKTLDCARGTFETIEIEPTLRRVRGGQRASGPSSPPERMPPPMAVKVKIPTQLRAATGGDATADVDGAHRRRGARLALRALRRAPQPDRRGRRAAPVRQRLRRRRGHPLPRRAADARCSDGDEVTILPAVAGG